MRARVGERFVLWLAIDLRFQAKFNLYDPSSSSQLIAALVLPRCGSARCQSYARYVGSRDNSDFSMHQVFA